MRFSALWFAVPLLALAMPAFGQDAPSFTPDDETAMQQCFEAARDIAANGDDTAGTSQADCIAVASNACQGEPGGSSTPGITDCNNREASWWDAQLNFYYEELKAKLEPDVFDSLKTAQRAWLAYREATCNFSYELWRDGTIRSVAYSSCMLEETARRSIALGEALNLES